MRVCVFGADLQAFEQPRLRQVVPLPPTPAVQEILLSNSRGLPPADGTHVALTAGVTTLRMRGLRWLLAHWRLGLPVRALAAAASRLSSALLLEGLRAADPDVIVALDPIWARELRRCIRRHGLPWPCVLPGEPLPVAHGSWRKYDPEAAVSIVLPTYNGTTYLSLSIESCLAQTHRNLELVVVDDGSDPAVAECVSGFSDPRIRFVRHDVNQGLPAALNTGFRAATGSLLTWTSDDNLYTPDAIEQMVRFLCTYPDVDFVYADAYEMDVAGNVAGMLWVQPPEFLSVKNRVGGCFLYRRAVYEAVGDYDRDAVLAEDYDYWLRVARRFTMQRLFRVLYYYRYHPQSLTARSARDEVVRQAERVKQTRGNRGKTTGIRSAT